MAENKVILIYGLLTEQAWSIKDLLYGLRGNFSCGIRRVVPSGQDSSILPTRLANHSARFGSSCPVTEFFFLFLQYAILLSKTLLAYGRRAGNLNWPIRIQWAGKTLLSWLQCKFAGKALKATFVAGDGTKYSRKGIYSCQNPISS